MNFAPHSPDLIVTSPDVSVFPFSKLPEKLTALFPLFQLLSCGGHLTKECYSLDLNKDPLKWNFHSNLTKTLSYNFHNVIQVGQRTIFMPNKGTYIFGTASSQFLPLGTKQWKEGKKYTGVFKEFATFYSKAPTIKLPTL